MKLVLLLILPTTLFGCALQDKATEGDRQLHWQNKQAIALVGKNVGAALDALKGTGSVALAMLAATLQPLADLAANNATLIKNQGEPKDKKDLSPQASKEAREKSDSDHTFLIGGVIGATLLSIWGFVKIAARYAPMVLEYIPGVGQFATTVRIGAGIINGLHNAADAQPDDHLHKNEMAGVIDAGLIGAPAMLIKAIGTPDAIPHDAPPAPPAV